MQDIPFEREELRVLHQIGRALWTQNHLVTERTLEMITALSATPRKQEKKLETALAGFLVRISEEGDAAHLTDSHNPFFRLAAEDRFLLCALQLEGFSYAELARILRTEADEIEKRALQIRREFAASVGIELLSLEGGALGPKCPSLETNRLWMQRFLDEALQPQERAFLQNHLMACVTCRKRLERTRKLFSEIEREMRECLNITEVEAINDVVQFAEKLRMEFSPQFTSKRHALSYFVKRPEVRAILLAGFVLMAIWAWR